MRTKSTEEQYLSDFLSKLGQGPGESGTIEVDALAALGKIEHEIDELLDAAKSGLRAMSALGWDQAPASGATAGIAKSYADCRAAIARAEGKGEQ